MKTKQFTIEIPDDGNGLADQIIAKAALHKKALQRGKASQGQTAGAIDEQLPDDQFLASSIRNEMIASYTMIMKQEAQQAAGKKAGEDVAEQIRKAMTGE